ncbi:MAG: discoidin domain-containing protein [Phycisphaerae bacterium]|nr:discoidin domain-containing protein [Phycisphaerae bacterium]
MLRERLYLVLGILVIGSGITHAELVAHWKFDEGAGTVALDSSGHGNDGVFEGNLLWVPGQLGEALEGNGNTDVIHVPNAPSLDITDAVTVALWLYGGTPPDQPISKGEWSVSYGIRLDDAAGRLRQVNWRGRGPAAPAPGNSLNSLTALPNNEWVHVAVTFDVAAPGNNQKIFINGVLDAENRSDTPLSSNTSDVRLFAEGYANTNRFIFGGMLDDIRIYNTALADSDIPAIMKGTPEELAFGPSPDDGLTDVLRDGVLTWTPGKFAAEHNVYFGESFSDVNSATVPAASGLTANAFDPGRLVFDQTYYWRVDEVNGAPDRTVFKGDVWSFTVEPYSIQIPVDVNGVTASSFSGKNTPAMTVNGSGLTGSTHSTNSEHMWLSTPGDMSPWLMYELDKTQKLDKMLIWNSNSSSEGFIGWGLKDVIIETSVDGAEWTAIAEATQVNRAPGLPTYDEPQAIDLGLVPARYVRLTILSNWGGLLKQYGVSEVQFYGLPVYARTPSPESGAVDVVPNAVAAWRAGREASQHTLYLGMDADAVAEGSSPSASSMTHSIDLSVFDLALGATYFWKVDEVNEAEVPSVWAGPVWSLNTAAFLVVDDFESYGNLSPDRPFQTWLDGFGYSADEFFPVTYAGNGTGAGIGHDIWGPSSPYFNGQIMETENTIAGSSQSMPFYYTNTGGAASQTERTFTPSQDWTVGGVQTLSIAFRGQAGNTGSLFAIINNVKVTYPLDPSHIALSAWQAWNIDLTAVNTNLQNITKLVIGVEGSGAAGMILIDDITLHAAPGEILTPVQPGTSNLILDYTFDAGAGASIADASGHGYTGTFEILPQYADGVSGSAASFNGTSNYISVPASVWSSVSTQFTVSFWARGDADLADNWGFFAGDAAGRIVSCHLPWGGEVIFDTTPGWAAERVIVGAASDELTGQWRHWTFVRNTETGEKQVYMDGLLYGSAAPSADPIAGIDRFFIGAGDGAVSPYMGLMDDFQMYDRALSPEEILWLAGVTTPIDKPF